MMEATIGHFNIGIACHYRHQSCARLSIVADCCCYGVPTPFNDGKAGMLAVVFTAGTASNPLTVNVEKMVAVLHEHLTKELPRYAVPTFVRVGIEIPTTPGTHKHQKNVLVSQGFNPAEVQGDNRLYIRQGGKRQNHQSYQYELLDKTMHAAILQGRTRL
jgi:hypothetical protein